MRPAQSDSICLTSAVGASVSSCRAAQITISTSTGARYERARFLRLDEVDWIAAAGNNVRFHVGKASYEMRMTLRVLLPQLDRAVFRRIHRSTVVNLNAIGEIQPWFAGDCIVLLNDGQRLRMSRTYRDQLMQDLL